MIEVRYSIENLLRVAQAFPATPRIMAELGRLLRNPNADLGDITAHLKHDTALAARLLRISNSAAFAPAEPVASIEDAAALIGLKEIHRLVGAVAIDQFSALGGLPALLDLCPDRIFVIGEDTVALFEKSECLSDHFAR